LAERSSQSPTGEEFPTSAAAAEYLASLLPELTSLADRAGLEVVAYLLEMARQAAEEHVGSAPRKPRRK
jgi:hypothetical protein